jgi:hypothetical protein
VTLRDRIGNLLSLSLGLWYYLVKYLTPPEFTATLIFGHFAVHKMVLFGIMELRIFLFRVVVLPSVMEMPIQERFFWHPIFWAQIFHFLFYMGSLFLPSYWRREFYFRDSMSLLGGFVIRLFAGSVTRFLQLRIRIWVLLFSASGE